MVVIWVNDFDKCSFFFFFTPVTELVNIYSYNYVHFINEFKKYVRNVYTFIACTSFQKIPLQDIYHK